MNAASMPLDPARAAADPVVRRAAIVGSLLLAAGGVAVAAALSPEHAWPWFAGVAPVWAFLIGVLRWLRRSEGQAGPLRLATSLTLARAWMIAALAGFVLVPPRAGILAWAPGILYTTAALLDLVDGYVARRLGQESAVGGRLDVITDALGLLIGPLAAIGLGRLPVWYLAVGAAYYLFHFGLWLRRRRGIPVYLERLKPSLHTRMYAGYQMGLVASALFPVLAPPGTILAATLFMVPPLALFIRDYLVTTGRLASDGAAHQRVLRALASTAGAVLPGVRVAAAVALAALVIRGQLPAPAIALALLILLGVGTRVVAFGAALALTWLLAHDRSALVWVADVLVLVTLLGGGGRAQLWDLEERWMLSRAGTASAAERANAPAPRRPSESLPLRAQLGSNAPHEARGAAAVRAHRALLPPGPAPGGRSRPHQGEAAGDRPHGPVRQRSEEGARVLPRPARLRGGLHPAKPDGSDRIAFIKINDQQYIELFDEPPRQDGRVYHISLYTDDVQALRARLMAAGVKASDIGIGKIKNTQFGIVDPDQHNIELVQYLPDGWSMRDKGKFMPESRVSTHIAHLGVLVGKLDPSLKFYRDTWASRRSGAAAPRTRCSAGSTCGCPTATTTWS
jgi:CDP-diacylglycerol--glycerol-3-phosphate 3-phosphatidyltransferase